ncbi:MAG: cupin domain-containing protein [Pseudomonadota bacterium]
MDVNTPLPLLGGLTAQQFMRRHWQKKPLLIRQAIPGMRPLLDRQALFALAASDDVESRLVVRQGERWRMRQGPFARRALPPLAQPDWTLLLQGMDLHHDGLHDLLQAFRFVPDARLDDLMVSYASDGGGVGPHFDSYDVFLLQAEGRRRWRIGRQKDLSLRDDVPLKILAHFEPEQEFVLEPGDMLYLPPRYAHDGDAQGACMTYSIGFRAPSKGEIARELLLRLADDADDATLYRDRDQPAVTDSARLPEGLEAFAKDALHALLQDGEALRRSLGEWATEPKPSVWFDTAGDGAAPDLSTGIRLDRRTRMQYDAQHVFINGESFRAGGRDARLMQQLAQTRQLTAADAQRLSTDAAELVATWQQSGWLHAQAL